MQQSAGRDASVDLAHVPQFELGDVLVLPALRQVRHGAASQILEPRVMQVLVALARAGGQVLSRDDLIASCWGGRVVGENAIARVIAQLRRINAALGTEGLRIETIPRVGYRLEGEVPAALRAVSPDRTAALPAPAPLPRTGWPGRRWLVAGGMLGALALVLMLAVLWLRPAPDGPRTVAIVEQGDQAGGLAHDMAVDLARLASARAEQLTVVSAGTDADFTVRVDTRRSGDRLVANLSLVARGEPELLWSITLDRAAHEAIDLRQQLAAKTGQVLLCAIGDSGARQIDPAALRLFLAACDRGESRSDSRRVALLRQVVARAPAFAQGWAELALAEAELGMYGVEADLSDPSQQQVLLQAAREHIERARTLDPGQGAAYAAEFTLVGRDRRRDNLEILERGLAAAPDYALLHFQRSMTLESLGYWQEAVDGARRAAALDPLSPQGRDRLVSALAYAGRIEEARREFEEAERIWPNAEGTREVRNRFHLRYGDPAQVLAMLDRGEIPNFDPDNPMAGRPFLRARAEPSRANVDALLRAARLHFERNPGALVPYVQLLGHFGQIEEGYRILESAEALRQLRFGAEVLFRPQMQGIRRDRRFMRLAARLGLVDHWQRRGLWPDFCGDPGLAYDCEAEASAAGSQIQSEAALRR